MYSEIIAILLPVVVCIGLGYGWQKRGYAYDSDFIGDLVMKIGAPCLVVSTLSKVALNRAELMEIGVLALAVSVLTGLCSYALLRWKRLPIKTYLLSFMFSNVGNMGLPLCLFAFGEKGLALGLAYFMLNCVAYFSLGIAFVSGGSVWKTLVSNPIVLSVFAAVIIIFTEWQMPVWLVNTTGLLGGFAIPLMLITLGVSLASLKVKHVSLALQLSVFKLAIGLGIGLLVTELLQVEGVLRGVVLIQASMPVAVFNFIIAQKYHRDPVAIAGIVVLSTAIVFIVLPPLLWFIM